MKHTRQSKKERNRSKGLIAFFLSFYDVQPVESLRYAIVERDSGQVIAHLVFTNRSLKDEKATRDFVTTARAGLQHHDH